MGCGSWVCYTTHIHLRLPSLPHLSSLSLSSSLSSLSSSLSLVNSSPLVFPLPSPLVLSSSLPPLFPFSLPSLPLPLSSHLLSSSLSLVNSPLTNNQTPARFGPGLALEGVLLKVPSKQQPEANGHGEQWSPHPTHHPPYLLLFIYIFNNILYLCMYNICCVSHIFCCFHYPNNRLTNKNP